MYFDFVKQFYCIGYPCTKTGLGGCNPLITTKQLKIQHIIPVKMLVYFFLNSDNLLNCYDVLVEDYY